MKKFVILHQGFEPPSPEDMNAWMAWFGSISERLVEKAGFADGRELTADGTTALPFGQDSLTGYTVITAADLDEAEAVARECPIVLSTRVYAVREH